jgi:peptide/nickel transport system substrate-binding protein
LGGWAGSGYPAESDLPPGVQPPVLPNFVRGDENADDGDWLVVTLGAEPNSLNPLIDNDATASDLFGRAHDSLAGRCFDDFTLWEPYLARAWTRELICRAYVKDRRAKELAAEIEARWPPELRQKLQLKRVAAESDEVLRLEIADVNNDYREALARDFGQSILKQYWFYLNFNGQKLLDRKTDLTAEALAPRVREAVEKASGFTGRVLDTWNRQDSVVLILSGDQPAREQAEKALDELIARPDNKAWVVDAHDPAGGHEEQCLSLGLVEEYLAQEKPIFTFYLRKDVKWHDGQPFTARDVVFTYQTMMNPKIEAGPSRNYYQDCQACELVDGDPYVVRFTWFKPYFDAFAASAGFTPMAEHYYRFVDPNDFNTGKQNQWLAGNADYKLVKWERNVEIVFERNEDYYRRKPHFKRVVYRVVKDRAVELQLFEAGQTDVHGLSPSQMKEKENDPAFRNRFKVNISVANVYRYAGWNARKPLFKDQRVRQALTMLMDRERICEDIMRDYAIPLNGPVHIENPAYWKDIDKHAWPYDPVRAERQLAEAGWRDTDDDGILDKDGMRFEFTLLIPAGNPETEAIANLIKDSFGEAGIEVRISNLEWAAFLQKIDRLQFDACLLGWRLDLTEDPYQLWHSSQTDEKESNFCYFVNKEADRLIERCRTELNEAKRNRMLWDFQKIILEEQPYTFMFVSKRLVAYDKRIQNVKYKLIGSNQPRWWVPKGLQKHHD